MEKNYKKFIRVLQDNIKELKPIATNICSQLGKTKGKIKAIIFDIYGTLLISAHCKYDDLQSAKNLKLAFDKCNIQLSNDALDIFAQILAQMDTVIHHHHKVQKSERKVSFPEVDILKVWEETIAFAVGKNWLQQNITAENLEILAFTFEVLNNKVFPMPAMKETITALAEKGMFLGIVSNAQFYTPIIMNYFLDAPVNSESIFPFQPDLCVYSYQKLIAKPDSQIFRVVLEQLTNKYSITASDVLYIGNDIQKDIVPAKQLGLQTALFAGDQRSYFYPEDKGFVKPDFIVTKLSQIMEII